jgi:hypothetical protein
MYAPDQDTQLSLYLRTMRIIVIALAMGVLAFLVVAVVIRQQNPNQPVPDPPIITITALGFAGLQLILQAVIPGLIATGLRRQLAAGKWPRPGILSVPADDVVKLCALYQTRLIIGAAIAEGAAFFLLIAYLLEGQLVALAGAAVMLALVLVRFPTRSGLEGWLSDQQEQLRQERMAG